MKKITLKVFFLLLFFSSSGQTGLDVLDNFINNWLGKPYKFGGTTKSGIDCSAFSRLLYEEVFDSKIKRTSKSQWEQTQRVSRDSLEIGDLVFFSSKLSPSGWHVGVYIGDTRFIHAANRHSGIIISSINEDRYFNSYKGAGRLISNKKESD